MELKQAVSLTLEQKIVTGAPDGVTIVRDLPGGWLAIVAKHPAKKPLVDYLKHPSEYLMGAALRNAERWAA